jgi:hypothetical protein
MRANLTDQTKAIDLDHKLNGRISILSEPEFERATSDLAVLDSIERAFTNPQLILPSYAVARLRVGGMM